MILFLSMTFAILILIFLLVLLYLIFHAPNNASRDVSHNNLAMEFSTFCALNCFN